MSPNSPYIQTLITIRLKSLHREGFSGVKYKDLEKVFFKYIYKNKIDIHLSEITDRILNIETDEIIQYLSLDATVSSSRMSLDEFLMGE